MKNLTDLINENMVNEAGIEASTETRIPVMYLDCGSGHNKKMWQFGYIVFIQNDMADNLWISFSSDGDNSSTSYHEPNFKRDIFVKFEDFDATYENLDDNKRKAIKEISNWAKKTDGLDWRGFKMK